MRIRRIFSALIVGLLFATTVACGSDDKPTTAKEPAIKGYKVIAKGTLKPGDEIPAPEGKPVLTLTGKISNTNTGASLALDMATLEKIGLVEYSVDDKPALKRRATFRGVLLADLLAVAGAAPEATTLATAALNDYKVDLPIADAKKYSVLIATTADGKRMPVAEYGPVRVIYPMDSLDLDTAVFEPRLNWQLTSIDVR